MRRLGYRLSGGMPVTVDLAGDIVDIGYRQELEALIQRYRMERDVRFHGRISYDAVPGFLATLDFYVCPSLMEMMPFNVLEAMAAGLAVVASAVGAIPDANRDGVEGLLVPPNQPPALADAIQKAMESACYADMARAARHRAESNFSVEAIAVKMRIVLQQIQ